MNRGHAVGVAHRARERQRVVLGQPAAGNRRGRTGVGGDGGADGFCRVDRIHRSRHCRCGRGVASVVGGHSGEAMQRACQRCRGEAPVTSADCGRAQIGRTVKDMHRGHAVGITHRARERQRVVLGQPTTADGGG